PPIIRWSSQYASRHSAHHSRVSSLHTTHGVMVSSGLMRLSKSRRRTRTARDTRKPSGRSRAAPPTHAKEGREARADAHEHHGYQALEHAHHRENQAHPEQSTGGEHHALHGL